MFQVDSMPFNSTIVESGNQWEKTSLVGKTKDDALPPVSDTAYNSLWVYMCLFVPRVRNVIVWGGGGKL